MWKGGNTVTEQYDICFLSVKEDAAAARELAESIQAYRLPRKLELPNPKLSYRKNYLDCDEAALDVARAERLNHTRFLVLICSPRTKYNPEILDRIEQFRKTHASEGIILCIVEGEPADSFPESFIEKKAVRQIMPDMSVVERIETIEPIAADIRADSKRRKREVLRYETVRITASVLELHPDDLEQRHRSRHRRAILAVLTIVGAVCLTAGAIFLRLGLIARNEGRIAEEQTKLSLSIAKRTMEDLPAAFEGNEQALGYIEEAIDNARSDLEEIGLGDLLETDKEETP